jgi:hypothetical protein
MLRIMPIVTNFINYVEKRLTRTDMSIIDIYVVNNHNGADTWLAREENLIAVTSSAAPTPGSSWARMNQLCSGYGGRSAGKSGPKIYRPTSSSNLGM